MGWYQRRVHGNTRTSTAGTIIVSEGENLKAMYLCKSGMIGVDANDDGILDHKITAPTFFGEESVLGAEKSRFTFTCISQCDFLELEKKEVARALLRFPRLRQKFTDLWKKRVAHFETVGVGGMPSVPDSSSGSGANDETEDQTQFETRKASLGLRPFGDEAMVKRVDKLEETVQTRFDAIDKQLRQLQELMSNMQKPS